jgi:hypothetical protein
VSDTTTTAALPNPKSVARATTEWLLLVAASCWLTTMESEPLHTLGVERIVPQLGMMAGIAMLLVGWLFRIALLGGDATFSRTQHFLIRLALPLLTGFMLGFSRL